MKRRNPAALALIAGLGIMATGAAPAPAPSDLSATVTGLRSDKGQVLVCLTTDPHAFPDCSHDAHARKMIVPARQAAHIDFGPVPEGRYAIALVHDENANGKLDKAILIPREGFGFSRDAPVRMGPPSFESAAFAVGAHGEAVTIRMRYML